jgi:hypothetical protein
MAAQMLGKLEILNKRATNGLASHPITRIVAEVRERSRLTEHRRVLGFMQSILSLSARVDEVLTLSVKLQLKPRFWAMVNMCEKID